MNKEIEEIKNDLDFARGVFDYTLNPNQCGLLLDYINQLENLLSRETNRKEIATYDNARLDKQLDLYKNVFDEIKEIIETKFLETELYRGELVCISVENYKKLKTILDKVGDK